MNKITKKYIAPLVLVVSAIGGEANADGFDFLFGKKPVQKTHEHSKHKHNHNNKCLEKTVHGIKHVGNLATDVAGDTTEVVGYGISSFGGFLQYAGKKIKGLGDEHFHYHKCPNCVPNYHGHNDQIQKPNMYKSNKSVQKPKVIREELPLPPGVKENNYQKSSQKKR